LTLRKGKEPKAKNARKIESLIAVVFLTSGMEKEKNMEDDMSGLVWQRGGKL